MGLDWLTPVEVRCLHWHVPVTLGVKGHVATTMPGRPSLYCGAKNHENIRLDGCHTATRRMSRNLSGHWLKVSSYARTSLAACHAGGVAAVAAKDGATSIVTSVTILFESPSRMTLRSVQVRLS